MIEATILSILSIIIALQAIWLMDLLSRVKDATAMKEAFDNLQVRYNTLYEENNALGKAKAELTIDRGTAISLALLFDQHCIAASRARETEEQNAAQCKDWVSAFSQREIRLVYVEVRDKFHRICKHHGIELQGTPPAQ